MSFTTRITKLTAFTVADVVAVRALNLLTMIVVIRSLPRADFGAVGMATGYLSVLALFALAPEAVLYRDYPAMKRRGEVNLYAGSFLLFGFLRTAVLVVMAAVMGAVFWASGRGLLLASVFVVLGAANNVMMLQNVGKELLKVDFRQKTAFLLNLALGGALFGAMMAALSLSPRLGTYLAVFGTGALVSTGAWLALLLVRYRVTLPSLPEARKALRHAIGDFSLWNHLNGSTTKMLYDIDTAVLGLLGVSLVVIGNYSVALRVANVFFVLPMILQGTATIGLANVNREKSDLFVSLLLKYMLLLSALQIAGFALFGRWAIRTFITDKDPDQIFRIGLVLVSAVAVLNMARPLLSWVNARGRLRAAFLEVYLPSGLAGLAAYAAATALWGEMGTAWANVGVYGLFLALLVLHVARRCPFRLRLTLFAAEERALVASILRPGSGEGGRG